MVQPMPVKGPLCLFLGVGSLVKCELGRLCAAELLAEKFDMSVSRSERSKTPPHPTTPHPPPPMRKVSPRRFKYSSP